MAGGIFGDLQSILFGDIGGDAADATRAAASVSAQAQQDALDYLKQRERIPSYYKDAATAYLGQLYGLGGDPSFLARNTLQSVPEQRRIGPGFTVAGEIPASADQRILGKTTAQAGLETPMDASGNPPYWDEYLQKKAEFEKIGAPLSYAEWRNAFKDYTVPPELEGKTRIPSDYLPQRPETDIVVPNIPGSNEPISTLKEKAGSLYPEMTQQEAQQQLIDQAMASPLYQNLLSGRQAGENAIMRQAAMTGGLRSGNTQHALYDYNTQLQNNALMQAYNQNLAGINQMAGLPTDSQNIASMMSNIGMTQAQGISGAAQAQMLGQQNWMNSLMGLGGMGLLAAI